MRKLVVFVLFSTLFVASFAFASEPKLLWTSDWLAESQRKMSNANNAVESKNDISLQMESALRHIDTVMLRAGVLLEKEFSFDIDGVRHTAKHSFTEWRSASDFSWFGFVDGGQFPSVFNQNGNSFASHIVADGFGGIKYYQIRPSFGKHVLEEVDVAKIMELVGDDLISVERLGLSAYKLQMEQNGKRRGVGVSYLDCPRGQIPLYTIDLLVIYDTTARSKFDTDDSVSVWVQSMVDMMNATLLNSKVTIGRFKLIGILPVNYTASGTSWTDFNWMVNDQGVAKMNDEKKADITSFMIGDIDGGPIGWG
ncbi:MAG: hypothetical protein AAB840_01170, partial [Patescibacteria group bacterium]